MVMTIVIIGLAVGPAKGGTQSQAYPLAHLARAFSGAPISSMDV